MPDAPRRSTPIPKLTNRERAARIMVISPAVFVLFLGIIAAVFGQFNTIAGDLVSAAVFYVILVAGAAIYHKRPEWSVFALALMLSSVAWDLSARYLFGLSRMSVLEAMLDWRFLSYVVPVFLGDYLIRRYRERRGARR